jgi:hypothetical protein
MTCPRAAPTHRHAPPYRQRMEAATALVVALLGGAGLTGIIAAATQWTRRARLRSRIEQNTTLAKLLPDNSSGQRALEAAAQSDAVDLAALTLEPLRGHLWAAYFMTTGALLWLVGNAQLREVIPDMTLAPSVGSALVVMAAGLLIYSLGRQPIANAQYRRRKRREHILAATDDALLPPRKEVRPASGWRELVWEFTGEPDWPYPHGRFVAAEDRNGHDRRRSGASSVPPST